MSDRVLKYVPSCWVQLLLALYGTGCFSLLKFECIGVIGFLVSLSVVFGPILGYLIYECFMEKKRYQIKHLKH